MMFYSLLSVKRSQWQI